jgi:lipopolysaccharide/colanic/teichoic acid biosynthesis glycosyltransferase
LLSKRIFDLAAASLGLAILAPVLLVVAALIKIESRGPVFFRQERVGLNGRTFRIHKFRTMRHTGDTVGGEITVRDDPRVTRVGRLLRKYKLDELPQLIDVLWRDMSLVGPRPEVPRYVRHYSERDKAIVLSVLPGITDFASIRFRDESALLGQASDPDAVYLRKILPRKLRYYRFYVQRRSLVLDIRLILMTICAVAGVRPYQ